MRRAILVAFLAASVARGEAPPDVPAFRVEPAASCVLKGERGPVGEGCWMPADSCIALANERQSQARPAARTAPAPSGGLGWKGAAVLVLVGLGAGYAAGKAVK